jgi:hypothetical protein
MNTIKSFVIKGVASTNIDELILFFKKAYGEETIFRSKLFLDWYFNKKIPGSVPMNKCLIGVSSANEIVSHYGGLDSELLIDNIIFPIVWGVNAYTFPEWRGMGINSEIVDRITENNTINGVIGFSEKTAMFYDTIGYNTFRHNRFSRFYRIIDIAKTKEVVEYIGQSVGGLRCEQEKYSTDANASIVRIDKNNYTKFTLDFDVNILVTTNRSYEYIKWRFLLNPFINYHVFGFKNDNAITSYIVCRAEQLQPFPYKALRIIDIFGADREIECLLTHVSCWSFSLRHIYVEFSVFGRIYNDVLRRSGFSRLIDDECATLPQTCFPITKRSNIEYVGLQSKKFDDLIRSLTIDNVYFTRMDSDRDRVAKESQLEGRKDEPG